MKDLPIHAEAYSYIDKLVEKFSDAITYYKRSLSQDSDSSPWVLFVGEDDERNMCDQKVIEVRLQQKYGIHSMRKTLTEV